MRLKSGTWAKAELCPLSCKQSEFVPDERISQNPKYKARKFERNSNREGQKSETVPSNDPATSHLGLEHSDFGFVSDFDIRISDLATTNGRTKFSPLCLAVRPATRVKSRRSSSTPDARRNSSRARSRNPPGDVARASADSRTNRSQAQS